MAGNTRHVVNMANSIVGVSILSMPYCFKESGLLLGVVMVLLSGVITKKTCMFLVRAAIMARHRSYEFLAFHVFGVKGKLAVELCMILFLIGICISFHVVMGDLAPAIAARLLHVHNTPSLRATLLLGIAVLVVLPLCLLRKLDNLASMSACSILFYFFLITVIFWHAFPRLVDGSWFHLAQLWRPSGVLQVLPICMLGLSCQSNVFEIYDSVPDPDVPKMRAVVNRALNLCCALYIAVGFFGYIAFVDQDMAGNLIMNFPASPLTEGIKLFFTVSLAISFPLMIFPCRTSIHSLVYRRNAQGYDLVGNYMPEARFKAITVGILAVSLVVGILVPNIEFVLGVLGSTMGVIISLVLPSIMFIKVNSKASVERLVAQGIMLMGVLLIVTGTYLNLTHTPHDTALAAGQAGEQEGVLALPPGLLNDGLHNLPPEKEGDLPVPHGEEGAAARVGAGDSATRREPVAPEPPPEEDEKEVKEAVKKKIKEEAVKEKEGGDGGGGGGGGGGVGGEDPREDTLHPDAIKKEEKEVHQEGGGEGGGGGGLKEQELLQKIEVQHREQQKILAEQKQILKELKDQKAQQEAAAAAAAAAAGPAPAAAQPGLPGLPAAGVQPGLPGLPAAGIQPGLPAAGVQPGLPAVPVAANAAAGLLAVPAAEYALPAAGQAAPMVPVAQAGPAVLPAGQVAPAVPGGQVLPAAGQAVPGVPAGQLAAAVGQMVPANNPAGQAVPAVPAGQVVPAGVPAGQAVGQVAPALPAAQVAPNGVSAAPVALAPAANYGQAAPALAMPAAPGAQMVPAAPVAQMVPAAPVAQMVPAAPAMPAAQVGGGVVPGGQAGQGAGQALPVVGEAAALAVPGGQLVPAAAAGVPAGQAAPAAPVAVGGGQVAPAVPVVPVVPAAPVAPIVPAVPAGGQVVPAAPVANVAPAVPAAPAAAGGQVAPAAPAAPVAPVAPLGPTPAAAAAAAAAVSQVAAKAAGGAGRGQSAAPVAPQAPRQSSPLPRLPHYPAAGLPAGQRPGKKSLPGQQPAKRGPEGYLEKMSSAAPKKPRRRHDEERRKRAAGPAPALVLGPEPEGAALPPVDLAGGQAAAGLSKAEAEAAFETRHLLWGSSRRPKNRHRRGGQRGGDEEYWDET